MALMRWREPVIVPAPGNLYRQPLKEKENKGTRASALPSEADETPPPGIGAEEQQTLGREEETPNKPHKGKKQRTNKGERRGGRRERERGGGGYAEFSTRPARSSCRAVSAHAGA